MGDSRSLDDLHPQVRAMAERLLADSAAAGIPLKVTFTLRSMAMQAALYAQGRTCLGAIVTNAKPGYSFHNFGLALDVVPTELLRLPRWGDTPAHQARTDALWARVGAIGKRLGFQWGGEFRSIRDRPHFEWSGGLTPADLRAGKRPATPSSIYPTELLPVPKTPYLGVHGTGSSSNNRERGKPLPARALCLRVVRSFAKVDGPSDSRCGTFRTARASSDT